MFFLKKRFDQYMEKRKFQREYKEFASNFEAMTDIKFEELKKMYSIDILPHDIGSAKQYEVYAFLSKYDIYASSYCFPASNEDAEQFESLIRAHFSFAGNRLYTRVNERGQTESLHLNMNSIFPFKDIEVCTNSSTFIQVLKETRIQCPPPWGVFDDPTLARFHPSQGETGFYNQFFWDPFWLRLDKTEKEQYYQPVEKV